jgi:hypothetical protein
LNPALREVTIMRCALLLAALLLGPSSLLRADTLILDGIEQAVPTAGERPHRGMTMQQVAQRWGEPAQKADAVGRPPITRWEYDSFTVYFEHEHVVHTVLRHHS